MGARWSGSATGFRPWCRSGFCPGRAVRLARRCPAAAACRVARQHRGAVYGPLGIHRAGSKVGVRVDQGLGELQADNPSDRRDVLQLPVGHGEGRFLADSESTLAELCRNGQVVLRYGDNFNGSQDSIAGICDTTGRSSFGPCCTRTDS